MKYKIIRFSIKGNKTEIIKTGLTLYEAQKWCCREDTHKTGVWFDGYGQE